MGSVTRGGDDSQREVLPDMDLVTVAHRMALKGHLLRRGDQIGHTELLGQRPSAGNIVVVNVSLGDVRDANASSRGGSHNTFSVPLRVDSHPDLAVMKHIRAVAELRRRQRDEVNHCAPRTSVTAMIPRRVHNGMAAPAPGREI